MKPHARSGLGPTEAQPPAQVRRGGEQAPQLPNRGPLSLVQKLELRDRQRRGRPQTWRRFLCIVQADPFFHTGEW